MYAYFKGSIEEKYEDGIVLDNNGIGYNILMPSGDIAGLPAIGSETKVYTYTSIKEDAMQLFGFSSREELKLFKLLITVSGIGPKGGLSILSALSPSAIRMAIITGDSKLISSAPGIGKKTAERVIIDLKDKVNKDDIAFAEDFVNSTGTVIDTSLPVANEAVDALVALGYGIAEAKSAVAKASNDIPDANDSGLLLKAALKYM